MKVRLMNKIAPVGVAELEKQGIAIAAEGEEAQGVLVRSASLHEMSLDGLLAIARAGAGVNNIPVDACAEAGVVVFNTPGANANGVKELAVCALLLASRDVLGGAAFAQSLQGQADAAAKVEKGKAAFAGQEIAGKTLGVIGLGAIGCLVADAAVKLGMKVIGCDPYLSLGAATRLNPAVQLAENFDQVYAAADYLTLHVPATPTTKGMINAEALCKMRDGVRLLNLARADLVCAADVKDALQSGKVACYVTDFPTPEVLGVKGIVAIPHLGASTEESEENCAVMAAREMADFLLHGNIRNSVNYPAVSLPEEGGVRVCVCHRNVPAVLASLTGVLSGEGRNIEHMANGSRGEMAYTLLSLDAAPTAAAVEKMQKVEGVLRVRVIA